MKTLSVVCGISMLAAFALTGCGVSTSAPVVAVVPNPVSSASAGVGISGVVHGGQQPIANSRVQLLAVGSAGYGVGATYTTGTDLLGSATVLTDVNGKFSLPSYTCPSATTNVYLLVTGGNPVVGQPANPNLAMMAAFGPCNSAAANASKTVLINERSTVAAVYALAAFMAGPTQIGSSATNVVGLNNAFAAVNKLVTLGSDVVPGPALPAGATVPVAELNTLADILAVCVNSTGGSAPGGVSDGTPCGRLFSYTPSAQGVYPTDTVTAMLNIAKNPQQQVVNLNNLPTGNAPFQPTLGNTPPSAWTMAITYAPTGLGTPTGIAADQQGNVWVANKGTSSVTLLAPSGAVTGTYAAGLAGQAVAVDQSGNAWSGGASALVKVPASGGTATMYTGGGLGTTTNAVAVDGSGNVWATGSQNGVSVFTNAGVPVSSTAYTGAGALNAQSIAITAH